jgi:hypothetical protein
LADSSTPSIYACIRRPRPGTDFLCVSRGVWTLPVIDGLDRCSYKLIAVTSSADSECERVVNNVTGVTRQSHIVTSSDQVCDPRARPDLPAAILCVLVLRLAQGLEASFSPRDTFIPITSFFT